MSPRPKIDVVVVDWHTTRKIKEYPTDDKLCRIILSGKKQNYRPGKHKIEAFTETDMHPLINDFYNISLAVYISDLHFRRLKIPNRTITILLSVSNKEKWDAHKESLEAVLYNLSADSIYFEFIQGKMTSINFSPEQSDVENVVSLFSGGMDSLGGVKYLLDAGKNPILVSHSSPAKAASKQNALYVNLNSQYPNRISHVGVFTSRKGDSISTPENSRRLRSFLYLTLGSIIALEKGISEVYIFENGIMSLNLPISNSRIFLNTKTTHPIYLSLYEKFIQEFFNADVSINNPFLVMTKAEVTALYDAHFVTLIDETISCSQTDKVRYGGHPTSKIWHCGTCLPCILRRISIDALGLASNDALYAVDVLGASASIPTSTKTLILEMLEFSREFISLTEIDDILNNFLQLLIPGFDHLVPEFITMYQRYVGEMRDFFTKSQAFAGYTP